MTVTGGRGGEGRGGEGRGGEGREAGRQAGGYSRCLPEPLDLPDLVCGRTS